MAYLLEEFNDMGILFNFHRFFEGCESGEVEKILCVEYFVIFFLFLIIFLEVFNFFMNTFQLSPTKFLAPS